MQIESQSAPCSFMSQRSAWCFSSARVKGDDGSIDEACYGSVSLGSDRCDLCVKGAVEGDGCCKEGCPPRSWCFDSRHNRDRSKIRSGDRRSHANGDVTLAPYMRAQQLVSLLAESEASDHLGGDLLGVFHRQKFISATRLGRLRLRAGSQETVKECNK